MRQQGTEIRKENQNDHTAFSRPFQGEGSYAPRQKQLQRFLMLRAKAAMTKDVLAVPPWLTLGELEGLFETRDFNGFPVVEGRQLVGMMTKFDFLKAFVFKPDSIVPHYAELMRTVEETMTRDVWTVHATTPLTRVLQMMVERRNQSFPVVDDNNCLLGVISRGDSVRALRT